MLKIEHVKKFYKNFSLDCSLKVMPGCVTGLIGQNGAGKSTAFKAILGLISIDEGSISVFGKDIQNFNAEDKQNLGVVLSDSGFSGYLTINDIIPVLDNLYKNFDKSFFIEQLQRFQLPRNKKIKEFSTGMKAKLKVLVAISHNAKLLILDEPTAALDPIQESHLYQQYAEISHGNTTIFISHRLGSTKLADTILLIDEGKILGCDTHDKLMETNLLYNEMFSIQKGWYVNGQEATTT